MTHPPASPSAKRWVSKLVSILLVFAGFGGSAVPSEGQNAGTLSDPEIKLNRTIGKAMLREIVGTMRREYWDKEFGGISLQDRQKKAIAAIESNERISDVFLTIAQFLLEFRDSHTRSPIVCQLRTFRVEEREINSMMAKARDYKKLILDIRGNSKGGSFRTNHFFEGGRGSRHPK